MGTTPHGWTPGGPRRPPATLWTGPAMFLGRHRGIHHYTLGQGRGLGVSGPHRYFVSAIEPEGNRVVLSDGSDLHAAAAYCVDPNWIAVDGLEKPMEVTVRLRHSRTEAPAVIRGMSGGIWIEMHTPAGRPRRASSPSSTRGTWWWAADGWQPRRDGRKSENCL